MGMVCCREERCGPNVGRDQTLVSSLEIMWMASSPRIMMTTHTEWDTPCHLSSPSL